METSKEYVERKIREPYLNIKALCEYLSIDRGRIFRVKNGKVVSQNTINMLEKFFRGMGE